MNNETSSIQLRDITAEYPEYWTLFLHHYLSDLFSLEESHEFVLKIAESAFVTFAIPSVESVEDYLKDSPIPKDRLQNEPDMAKEHLKILYDLKAPLTTITSEKIHKLRRRSSYIQPLQTLNYI